MAFRSWYALITATALGSAQLAKAEPFPSLPAASQISTTGSSLDLQLYSLPAQPQITLETINRCPPSFTEILQPPRIITELPSNHPLREIVLDAWGGETSKDPGYDELRLEILESVKPLCTRTGALSPATETEALEQKLSFFPKDVQWRQNRGSSFTEIRLELPGDLHYVVIGPGHNSIVYSSSDNSSSEYNSSSVNSPDHNTISSRELSYHLRDKQIKLSLDGQPRSWGLPNLNLENIIIGFMPLPELIDSFNDYPRAAGKFGSSVNTFLNGVITNLQLTDAQGNPSARGIELGFKLRDVFEEVLPQYFANDGVIDPDEWLKIQAALEEKILEFRTMELNDDERNGINQAFELFQGQFYQLQNEFPLIRNLWEIYRSGEPASRIKLGGISFKDAYDWLLALDPKLYSLEITPNKIVFKTNNLHSTLDARSSDYVEIDFGAGRKFIETSAGLLQMEASGNLQMEAALTPGLDVDEIVPEKFDRNYELIKLILAIDPRLIDPEVSGRVQFQSQLIAERLSGVMTTFSENNYTLGNYTLGADFSWGSVYKNKVLGLAVVEGTADSDNNQISADLAAQLQIQQSLGNRQRLGFFIHGEKSKNENSKSKNSQQPWSWFNARIGAELEQLVELTEFSGAAWKFRADYQGKVIQHAWLNFQNTERETRNDLAFTGSARGGINAGIFDLFASGSVLELETGALLNPERAAALGAGLFLNTGQATALAECVLPKYCQLSARMALDKLIDTNKARRHFLNLQKLADSPIAGVEAVKNGENRRYNLSAPGLFIDAEISQKSALLFPYSPSTNAQLGLAVLDPENPLGIDLYLAAKYSGNFSDVHGFRLDLSSEQWDSFFGLTLTKDQFRNSNSISGTFGLTLHLGLVDIVTREELYPDPLVQQPEYKEVTKKDPITNREIKYYEKKRQGDFRILAEIRARPEFIDQLIAAIPQPLVSSMQLSGSKGLKSAEDMSAKAVLQYNFGSLNLYNAVEASLSKDEAAILNLEAEALYLIGLLNLTGSSGSNSSSELSPSSGFGPSLVASQSLGSDDENYRFLPGAGLQISDSGGHNFKAIISGFYDQGLISDILVRYKYDDYQKNISPYLQLDTSLFSRVNSSGLNNLHSYARLAWGLRAGPLLLSAGGGFKADRNKKAELIADVNLGIDITYFLNQKNK